MHINDKERIIYISEREFSLESGSETTLTAMGRAGSRLPKCSKIAFSGPKHFRMMKKAQDPPPLKYNFTAFGDIRFGPILSPISAQIGSEPTVARSIITDDIFSHQTLKK